MANQLSRGVVARESIVVYSGSSHHMVWDRSAFLHFKSKRSEIEVAGGNHLECLGEGEVQVEMRTQSGQRRISHAGRCSVCPRTQEPPILGECERLERGGDEL